MNSEETINLNDLVEKYNGDLYSGAFHKEKDFSQEDVEQLKKIINFLKCN